MMGRKQKLISALEDDVIFDRHTYPYLKNNNGLVKWAKRRMNKRMRRNAMSAMQKDPDAYGGCWHGDEDDGKAKARTTGATVSIGATKNCYTAAEMKAARLETVERCMNVVIEATQKIREEINEG